MRDIVSECACALVVHTRCAVSEPSTTRRRATREAQKSKSFCASHAHFKSDCALHAHRKSSCALHAQCEKMICVLLSACSANFRPAKLKKNVNVLRERAGERSERDREEVQPGFVFGLPLSMHERVPIFLKWSCEVIKHNPC